MSGIVYDPDAQSLFDRMSVQPTGARKTLINEFILGIKSDLSITNLYDAFDTLKFYAGSNQADSRLNWVNSSHATTEGNTPTWTLDRGYTGNSIDMYLDDNYNPATQGVNFTRNNASYGIYSRTDSAEASIEMGNWDGATGNILTPRSGTSVLSVRVNSSGFSGDTVANSLGLFSGARLADASNLKTYHNGSLVETQAAASSALISVNMFVLAYSSSGTATSFGTRQIAFSYTGSGTLINQVNLYTRVEAYLDAIGAGVV